MKERRVKYYPLNDLACGYGLDKIESINYTSVDDYSRSVNDVIELYNIKQYFDNGIRRSNWTDWDYAKHEDLVKNFNTIIYKYFNSITEENIAEILNTLDVDYEDDFLALYVKCKRYKNVPGDVFVSLINYRLFRMCFQYNALITYYEDDVKKRLLSKSEMAELVIHVLELQASGEKAYLPNNISIEEYGMLFQSYVDDINSNLNILHSISLIEKNINPIIKYNAYKKYNELVEKHINTSNGIAFGTHVSFMPNQSEAFSTKYENNTIDVVYDLTWITENLDYPTLWNNFIHLFGYIDQQGRISHVNVKSQLGIFEQVMLCKPRGFNSGFAFQGLEALADLQLISYQKILSNHDISIESLLSWFFSDYIVKEFKLPNIEIHMPADDLTHAEHKCIIICAAFDSAIRQYSSYVRYGKIDPDFIRFESGHMKYGDIPSLLSFKYVQGVGQDYRNLIHLLFSNQSMLSYVHRFGNSYDSFEEVLLKEKVKVADYLEQDQHSLNWLKQKCLIDIDSDGYIAMINKPCWLILKDLNNHDVISYHHLDEELNKAIEYLYSQGFLQFYTSFFSYPEINLLNYYLNKDSFVDSREIRNRYIHGAMYAASEKEHKKNYLILLRMFVYLALKINDELCLAFPEEIM